MDCDCACAAAPDYSGVANASKESAQIMADLGQKQLDETRRQYDEGMKVTQPVIDAQLDIMSQTKQQGADQYQYQQDTFRPVEESLAADAAKSGSDAMQEEAAGKAIADTRAGSTAATNAMIRQGIRFGMSPGAIAAKMAEAGTGLASAEASAANAARTQEKTTGFAKKLDVAGIGRNLTGASQGAYSLAVNSGNSAAANKNATSAQLLNGMAQGASITGQGQSMAIGGLSNVLNAQTSYANSVNQAMSSGGGGLGGLGSLLGGVAAIAPKLSDRRLKDCIVLVGKDERTGLALYEFNYIGEPGHRYRGVMADEVESVCPDAVVYDDLGFASVNYGMLGLEMVEIEQ